MAAELRRVLPDEAGRRRAATDFATNLVVLAGAGTGKTSLLVERALNAIGSGVAEMRQLAAITFTEKAAGEMRERLAQGLDRLRRLALTEVEADGSLEADRAYRYLSGDARQADETIAARSLAAMEALDHGAVMTIHSFCADLLRAHPFEAGVDPGFTVDSGAVLKSRGQRQWEAFLRRELGPEGVRAKQWSELLAHVSLDQIGKVALALVDESVPAELLSAGGGTASATELFVAEAERLAGEIDALYGRATGLTPTAQSYFPSVRQALTTFASSGAAAMRVLVDADDDLTYRLQNMPTTGVKLAGVTKEEHDGLARRARDLVRGVQSANDEVMHLLVDLTAPFALAFREEFLRSGRISFNGLLVLTRNLLRDRPEVRRALKQRFRLLLVDEFQDTDPMQYEIVLFLAEREQGAAERAFDANLEPGRLFIVGDAKQSIYRFRGADYTAYRAAIDRIVEAGGATIHLTGNFRSVAGVLDPVNELFEGSDGCWEPSAHQPEYRSIVPVREDTGSAPAVELWSIELPPGSKAEQRREAEGRVLAEAIERWVAEQRLEYEQITILFRAFTNITYYLRPLRERGIPFVVDGGREFLKRPEVAQLMATLRALSQPANQPALLAFLRSPAGGTGDVELDRYAASRGRWSWRAKPDPAAFPNIARSFETMRRLTVETRDLPVDALVRQVLDTTLLLPLGASAFEGAQRVANLQKLAAAAAELARDGALGLDEVLEAIEEGRLEDIETDRPLADDAAHAVRITSIHRMKGLENHVILLPDLARQKNRGQRESPPLALALLPDGRTELGLHAGRWSNAARVWFDRENDRHSEAEEVRVLYVALTRARERLIVLAGPSRSTAPWLEALAPWGYDRQALLADGASLCHGRVLHRRVQAQPRQSPPEARVPGEATCAVRDYERAVASLKNAARPPIARPSGLHEERESRLGARRGWLPPAVRNAREIGKAAGIVLHRLLETGDAGNENSLRDRLDRLCAETALEVRADEAALRAEATEILDAFLASDLPGLLAGLLPIGRELPVLVRQGSGQLYRGSIDLLYRTAQGEIVVADYKTDRETDEAALVRSYTGQLGVYAEAVRGALGLDRRPRVELWLLRSGRVLELSDAAPPPPEERGSPGQLSLF